MAGRGAGRRGFNSEVMANSFQSDLENAHSGAGSYGIFVGLPQKEWLRLKEGEQYTLRFLPWLENEDERKPKWYLEAKVHKYVGPPQNGRDYLCRAYIGQKCALCEELDKNASNRYFFNVLHKTRTGFVHKLIELNSPAYQALCKAAETTNADTGEKITTFFMDPDAGCNVAFTAKEVNKNGMKWLEPGAVGFGSPSAITDAEYDMALDLHSYIHAFENIQLLDAVDGNHPTVSNDSSPRQETPSRNPVERESPRESATTESPAVEATVEPELPPRRMITEAPTSEERKCSMGFPFGNKDHCMKHDECNKCDEAEWKECANTAGVKVK